MRKNNGFTLIELLAVIVILVIILVIAVPQILNVIRNSAIGAMESDAKLVLNTIIQKKVLDADFDPTRYNNDLQSLLDELGISGENYNSVSFSYNNDTLLITVEGKNKYGGLTACGSYHNMTVSQGKCNMDLVPPVITLNGNNEMEVDYGISYIELGATVTDNVDDDIKLNITGTVDANTEGIYTITYKATDSSGNSTSISRTVRVVSIKYAGPEYIDLKSVNGPVLATGMIPIIWDGDSWKETSIYDRRWYNYTESDKKWANAKTADGSMWVWIPRYIYKMRSGWHKNYGGNNMIDPSILVNNKDINVTTGQESTSGTRTIVTDYIDIEPNTTYTITRPVNIGNMGARYYDINKNYLGATPTISGILSTTITFTTPSNAYYFKFIDESNTLNIGYQLEKGSTATPYKSPDPAGDIEIQFSKGTNDDWNNTAIGNIDTGITSTSSRFKWTNHPAFTFGNKEVTGIWVAKFEATSAEGVATSTGTCDSGDNVTTKNIKVIPNATSWRCISIGNSFTVSKNMEINSRYGWGTSGNNIDTHLMKNIEWGAITYLSKSKYGKKDEVWINPANNYMTGCVGNDASSASTTGCINEYNTAKGSYASTTGNISGIYDMNGNAWEMVSSYLNNNNTNLNNGSSITNVSTNVKYKDIYNVEVTDNNINNYNATINKKGDALYETSKTGASSNNAWYGDYVFIMETTYPWLIRGGYYNRNSSSGLFSFARSDGAANLNNGFRPVLIIGEGL